MFSITIKLLTKTIYKNLVSVARDFFFFSHRPFPAPPTAQEYTQAFFTYNKMTGCVPLKKNNKKTVINACYEQALHSVYESTVSSNT